MSLTPSKILEPNYNVIDKLGQGGYGQVYLVENKKTRRESAVKFFQIFEDWDIAPDFILEVNAYNTIRAAPGILELEKFSSFIDSASKTISTFIFLPLYESNLFRYAESLSLAERLKVFGTLKEYMLNALYYLEINGLVHGDIKELNILVRANEFVLADFGLAKQMGCQESLRPEKEYSIAYTVSYRAPEVVAQLGYDMKADVWAMGVTFMNFLTLNRFWKDQQLADLVPWVEAHTEVSLIRMIKDETPESGKATKVDVDQWFFSNGVTVDDETLNLIETMLTVIAKKRPYASELLRYYTLINYSPKSLEIERINWSERYKSNWMYIIENMAYLCPYPQALACAFDILSRYLSLRKNKNLSYSAYAATALAATIFVRDFPFKDVKKQSKNYEIFNFTLLDIMNALEGRLHDCASDVLAYYFVEIGIAEIRKKLKKLKQSDIFIFDLDYEEMVETLIAI